MSLASATLIYEWRRYLAAVVALAFSGLLVLAQIGMFMGIGKAFTASIDRARADVMVLGPKAESLMNGGSGVPRRILPQVYMNPRVLDVADLDGGGLVWQNLPDGSQKKKREYVDITAIDTAPASVTLPTDFDEATRVALLEPYAVVVDQSALARLGVKLGDKATLGGKAVYVRHVITGYPNMMQGTVYVSRDTLRLLGQASEGEQIGPLMVRLSNPGDAVRVRDELNAKSNGKYRAWTRAELSEANQGAMLKEQIIGVMLGFSLFLGLLIGISITSQTLRAAILANIKEFASLRALGVSMGDLQLTVLELSFWVGITGLAATAVLTFGVYLLASAFGLPLVFPVPTVTFIAVFLVGIAMVSGMMALGVLRKSQPADLLR
ncbi:MAG: permease [Caulobacterales bacterium 68-7]|nr:MAG: permease [Caulobacterales bacterium 68-7]